MIEHVIEVLKQRYDVQDLMDKTLSEEARLELIVKLETIVEIEEIVKGGE